MADYIALVHKDPDSSYGVSFPDFPGCITAGDTIEEARKNAEEVLPFHIAGMLEDGETLPAPSTLEKIRADPENQDALAFLVITLAERDRKAA
jgi:predicted RNase H-like HicB family nuclease